MPCGLPWSEAFVHQLSDKEFRDEFVADQVRLRIAMGIRALREQSSRNWSQSELGERMNKPQSVVSRLESPDYGKASLQTLLEIAAAFDLPLRVDMPEWDEWARWSANLREECLRRESFDAEKLMAQAKAAKQEVATGNIATLEIRQNGRVPTATRETFIRLAQ